jgi:hypothetical protein
MLHFSSCPFAKIARNLLFIVVVLVLLVVSMLRRSERQQFLYGFHLEIQKEILKSLAVPLLCFDTSDEESDEEVERNYDVMSKAFVYSAIEDSRYIFLPLTYQPDVRGTRLMDNTPRWKANIEGRNIQ